MDNPLTVLHVIDTGGPGGAETVFHRIVTGLDARRWRPVPVIPGGGWLHDALTSSGVSPVVLPQGGWSSCSAVRLRRLIRTEGVRLVHTHLLRSAVYSSVATTFSSVPVISTFHGEPDVPPASRVVRAKARLIARRRNRVVFVSETLRSRLLHRFPVPEDLTRVIYNGVDPNPPTPDGSEAEMLGRREGTFLLGAVGNLRPAKDYGTLLRAVHELRCREIPVRCVVIGEVHGGPLVEKLMDQWRRLGLESVVEFLGFRDDARRFLPALDVLVSSSTDEGCPLSMVEALMASTPVVATRSGGSEEIVRDGYTGLVVPSGSPTALADALERAYRSPVQMDRMAQAGAREMRERFSLGRMLDDYATLYDEVL